MATITPPRPITRDERARLMSAPPEVNRTVLWIARRRLTDGYVDPWEVWGVYRHGDPRRWPRRNRQIDSTDANGRQVTRWERADVRYLLDDLRPYGVRFILDAGRPTEVWIKRPVYVILRAVAVSVLTDAGAWPPRVRYRGPKRSRK